MRGSLIRAAQAKMGWAEFNLTKGKTAAALTLIQKAQAILDEALAHPVTSYGPREAKGGDRMNQEITVTYRAKSGTVTENEIREQAQQLQQNAPNGWEIKEAHLNQPLFGSGSTSGSGS